MENPCQIVGVKLERVPARKWKILNSGESLPDSGRF